MFKSIIPVSIRQTAKGVKKEPDFRLLKRATGDNKIQGFFNVPPTDRQREIFNQASHQAVITGEVSGVTVVDLDEGAEQFLKSKGIDLPETPTVRTFSGGLHLYFNYNKDLKTDSKVNEAENIDIRNDRGYAVFEGEGYEWIISPLDADFQDVPAWVHEMVSVKPSPVVKTHESVSDAWQRASGVDMVSFLTEKGYDVSRERHFHCIYEEHEDNNPSAVIWQNKHGQDRYRCFSHPGGELNAGIVDLWSSISGQSRIEALNDILEHIGEAYRESDFVKQQKEKYHQNTIAVNDLSYIESNFPNLYKYLNRYELELRALMDYAESNIKGTRYSIDGEAVFFLSRRHATGFFTKYANRSALNNEKAYNVIKLLTLFRFIERVDSSKLHSDVRMKARENAKTLDSGRQVEVNYFKFNLLTDEVFSIAERRAKVLNERHFKIRTMKKQTIRALFGEKVANEVFPGFVSAKGYHDKKSLFADSINRLIAENGFTSRSEVIGSIDTNGSKRTLESQFDAVIYEICDDYSLEFKQANKEIRERFDITGRGRKKVIFKEVDFQ